MAAQCKAVVDSLEEAGDRLFTFARLPCGQWKRTHTTNAIARLHEEFKRRINTQTVLPSAETGSDVVLGLLGADQITMRKSTDGRLSPRSSPTNRLTSLLDPNIFIQSETAPNNCQRKSRRHLLPLNRPAGVSRERASDRIRQMPNGRRSAARSEDNQSTRRWAM
jgi:hypothetical protein